MKKQKELIKNTIIIMIGKIFTQLISFLMLPLYTSYLITEEYGIVDLITNYVALLVPLFSLQLETAIFRFLIEVRNSDREKTKLISTNLILMLFFILLFVVLFLITNIFVSIKYSIYILLIIAINMISSDFMQIARGLGRNIDYSISGVISGVTTIILNVIFIVFMKMGAKGMLLAILIANILNVIYLFARLKIYLFIKKDNYEKAIAKDMLKYSIPLIPNSISWWVMNVSDRTIISTVLGVAQNGIYAVSNKFPAILSSLFGMFNLSWSESASININDDDRNQFFSSVFNNVISFFGYIGLILLSVIPIIFSILVKGGYEDAYFYIPILLYASFFSLMAAQYGSIYIAKKETKKIAITTIVSALINILINVLLINKIGLYAASLSTVFSYMFIMIYRHCDTKKYVQIKYNIKDIFIISILAVITTFFYYQKMTLINILLIIINIIVFFVFNWKKIKKIVFSIISKIIKNGDKI